jgi:hypothetical protein
MLSFQAHWAPALLQARSPLFHARLARRPLFRGMLPSCAAGKLGPT